MPSKAAKSPKLFHNAWRRFCLHLLRSLMHSLGQLLRTPVNTLATTLIVGVTLAMPLGLWLGLAHLHTMLPNYEQQAPITAYLNLDVSREAAEHLSNALQHQEAIDNVTYISPEAGLAQFKQNTDFGDVLDKLDHNPLPGVLVITPRRSDDITVHALLRTLKTNPAIDAVKLDANWIQRLDAVFALAKRATYFVAALLGVGVLLIIGNTIALTMQKHHSTMRIYQLLGASDRFIRLPFICMGMYLGVLGSLAAYGIVQLGGYFLKPTMQQLSSVYPIHGNTLSAPMTWLIACMGMTALLGMLGASFAVSKYLRQNTASKN